MSIESNTVLLTAQYTIQGNESAGYVVVRDGVTLRRLDGGPRVYRTPNGARKFITRDRRGNYKD